MSDIDFDELDKAVNSLVGDGGSKNDTTGSPDVNNKPEPDNNTGDNIADKKNTSGTLPSKRAGRFMDVKHTSSDMQPPSTLMNKGENSLEAPSDDIKEKKDDQVDEKEKVPDNNQDLDDKSDKETKQDDDGVENTDKPEETEEKKDSPFIEDAKVEKRPLGGYSPDSPVDPPKEDATGEPTTEAAQTVELPPELDKDLVAIEAGESPDSIKSPDEFDDDSDVKEDDQEMEKEEPGSKEDESDKTDDEKDKEDQPKDHRERVAELLASASSGSIPEQYKRDNRSHELNHSAHPLFDADHFKNTPEGPSIKKPKSATAKFFQWFLIYTGLVLLGASLGAAVFVIVSQS